MSSAGIFGQVTLADVVRMRLLKHPAGGGLADFAELTRALSPRRRLQLIFLAFIMLASGFAEMVSLGAIVPFLAMLADPERMLKSGLVSRIASLFGQSDVDELRWYFTVLFAGVAVLTNCVRFGLIYFSSRLAYRVGHELSTEVYRRTLYQPYEVHVGRNSSALLGGIAKVDTAVWTLLGLLNGLGALFMAIFIIVALVLIDPLVAVIAVCGFSLIYGLATLVTRRQLAKNGEIANAALNERVQCLQEGLGGIRDVLLDHSQPVFIRRFGKVDLPLRDAMANNNVIVAFPRFLVEGLGILLITSLAYGLTRSEQGMAGAIPVLGALALAAQRLMPLLQQVYQGWASIVGGRQAVRDVLLLLRQTVDPLVETAVSPLPFEREICFRNVSFRYQLQGPFVLHELNLTIPKGARIGLVGPTGSGKSTAMDLLLGLLQPTEGIIFVDDVPLTGAARLRWQRNIAHVPQSIFLADTSFAENIAFGVPMEQIDHQRLSKAAQEAQIADVIENSRDGYNTLIGERGVRLSGGQRQRLGIARALYRSANVLVFDEATSSLDSETESAVMQAIESLRKELTIILVAHRVTTLRRCDIIYRLERGRLVSSGNYNSLFARAAT